VDCAVTDEDSLSESARLLSSTVAVAAFSIEPIDFGVAVFGVLGDFEDDPADVGEVADAAVVADLGSIVEVMVMETDLGDLGAMGTTTSLGRIESKDKRLTSGRSLTEVPEAAVAAVAVVVVVVAVVVSVLMVTPLLFGGCLSSTTGFSGSTITTCLTSCFAAILDTDTVTGALPVAAFSAAGVGVVANVVSVVA
jgi:hypothetical protein